MSRIKALLLGIVFILLIGIGGLVYRNAAEHPYQQIACPLDAKICPDGTSLSRTGSACLFPACPPPNVTLPSAGIAYAVPAGFAAVTPPDKSSIAAYELATAASSTTTVGTTTVTTIATTTAEIVIRRYPLVISTSTSPLSVIEATAIGGASGTPVPPTNYTSTIIARQNFTIVPIERFEGVVDTAYYLTHGSDLLRFDAIDRGVSNWTDPNLDTSTLPAQAALKQFLTTLQGSD